VCEGEVEVGIELLMMHGAKSDQFHYFATQQQSFLWLELIYEISQRPENIKRDKKNNNRDDKYNLQSQKVDAFHAPKLNSLVHPSYLLSHSVLFFLMQARDKMETCRWKLSKAAFKRNFSSLSIKMMEEMLMMFGGKKNEEEKRLINNRKIFFITTTHNTTEKFNKK
jgi:hypothetical protein